MKCFALFLGICVASFAMLRSADGTEIETFDSPNQFQGGSNFAFADPIEGSFSSSNGGTITDNTTNVEITGSTGYGTAYKNIASADTALPGGSSHSVSILGSTTLQLDLTINTGDAGPYVDLQDGEGDFYQYFFGYGLVGIASNNGPPQESGELISQGADPNELILEVPLATPHADLGKTGTFDFSQITLFRLEDDPGGSGPYDISFNDLSATGGSAPEPASLAIVAVGGLLLLGRCSRTRRQATLGGIDRRPADK